MANKRTEHNHLALSPMPNWANEPDEFLNSLIRDRDDPQANRARNTILIGGIKINMANEINSQQAHKYAKMVCDISDFIIDNCEGGTKFKLREVFDAIAGANKVSTENQLRIVQYLCYDMLLRINLKSKIKYYNSQEFITSYSNMTYMVFETLFMKIDNHIYYRVLNAHYEIFNAEKNLNNARMFIEYISKTILNNITTYRF